MPSTPSGSYEGFRRRYIPGLPEQPSKQAMPVYPWNQKQPSGLVSPDGRPLVDLRPNNVVVSRVAHEAGRRTVMLSAGTFLSHNGQNPADLEPGVVGSLGGQHVHIIDETSVTPVVVHILPSER